MVTAKDYEVKKGWLGGRNVSYPCPHCGERLRSPLTDAGQQDSCPTCNDVFVVPGSADLHRITEAEKLAKQDEARLKEQAKEEARLRKVRLEQQREAALKKSAAERAEQERLAEEAGQAKIDAAEAASGNSDQAKPKALPWRSGGGAAAAVLVLLIYVFARGADLRDKLSRCESNGVVEARVSYAGLFGTDTVVFDLRDGGSSGARRIDPVHLLMQFSSKLNLYSVDRVVLARNGDRRFYITSNNLRPLADSYKGGGRSWAFNNLPANVRRMDGTRAYNEWTGGWLGVLQKQSEDLNRFITAWTGYGSGGGYSAKPSYFTPSTNAEPIGDDHALGYSWL
jgi:hypothetical protein